MEEDDEIQSPSSPTPNGRITVTVAAAPPSNSLTLALPIQPQKTPGSGGGREDCWSEGATAVLIDAWGERYLELSRGNLKQKHWKDVADIVSSREDYAKTPKTDIQCKNRIDTVKKKYKTEKAKIASGGGPSKWRFFDKLDELIGPTPSKSNSTPPPPMDLYQRGVPMGISVGIRSSSSVQKPLLKRPSFESEDESEPENSADSSDGLPPDTYNNKRGKIQKMEMPTANNANGSSSQRRHGGGMRGNGRKNKEESNWANSMKELTRAVLKFGEAYEQAETAKLQQLVEMEKQRMKFAKDLELQRMQYFMKTQMELSQLKNRSSANTNNHHHHHRRVISNNKKNNNDANDSNHNNTKNNNNNSDSSN
ncbi:hypothetical protein ACP275_09G145400 [Erythranthe tilingii]